MRTVSYALIACLALSIAGAASAQTRLQAPDTAPERAKPDLVVIKAVRGPDYANGDGRIFVQVKNIGASKSAKAQSLATHDNTVGCGTYFMVPELTPGAVSSHTLRYCKDVPEGARIRVIADTANKVAESKENNNIRHFNW